MTEKRFTYNVNKNCIEYDGKFVAYLNSRDGCRIANYWNGLYKENEQLKKDRFICLDCEHSRYAELSCLCEYTGDWQEYMTECEDFKELSE